MKLILILEDYSPINFTSWRQIGSITVAATSGSEQIGKRITTIACLCCLRRQLSRTVRNPRPGSSPANSHHIFFTIHIGHGMLLCIIPLSTTN